MPPPSTPAPSRFLLSKRTVTVPDQGGSSTPSQTQPRQFVSTPRFAAPSTTQPQSQSNTPIVPGSRRPFVSSSIKVAKPPADDIDVLDSSQSLEEGEEGECSDDDRDGRRLSRPLRRSGLQKHDSIIENSPSLSSERSIESSSHGIFGGNQHGYEETSPAPKRRRITVSPTSIEHVSSSSQGLSEAENQHDEDDVMSNVPDSEQQDEIPPSEGSSSLHHYEDQGPGHSLNEEIAKSEHSDEPMQETIASDVEMSFEVRLESAQQQQQDATSYRHPKFQEAPRFVTTEPPEQRQFYLPDAFSPQRRGARHIAGGLAAEVRDWLFQVKGNGAEMHYSNHSNQPLLATPTAKYIADQVSAGPSMQMLLGRPVWPTEANTSSLNDGEYTEQTQHHVKLILAGDGRMSGLAGKNIVTQKTVIVVHPPTWKINLQNQGTWTMVCDWSIADDIAPKSPRPCG